MEQQKNMAEVIKESFTQYSGAVLQSRALVDVRDCIKPSARQILYCLYTDKFLHNKPFKKTMKALGSAMRLYIHGDASCVGVMMRNGQPFAMRYPLTEVEGNGGNIIETGNWAAPRYTGTRLSELSSYLMQDIKKKDIISEWRDNYDDTEKYPAVLPSKGFYNIVNGTSGIGIGMGSSCPQFNIKDVNAALEKLLLNPDIDFEEIYCTPDFATGGYLINEKEVKEALKYGSKQKAKDNDAEGASCKLRAKIEIDPEDSEGRTLVVTEVPYGVYTNTIVKELDQILESDDNPGIERYNDLTGTTPNIKIYPAKGVPHKKIINYLYKHTSLQYHFSINLIMLDQGRFPKMFTWKEMLQAHIDHEKEIYRLGFEHDLKDLQHKVPIIDGLLICLASIDEVVKVIKSSESTKVASANLIKNFLLDEEQAKAVLDMKLSRLAHLEIEKLKDDKLKLEHEIARINSILTHEDLFNNELIKGWRETAKKFGDEHRTKVITVTEDPEDEVEMVTPQDCVVVLNKAGSIKRVPAASFKTQKRGGKGIKNAGDVIVDTISTNTVDTLMIFTDKGKMYKLLVDNIPEGTNASKGIDIGALIELGVDEEVIAITSLYRKSKAKYVVFITKNGLVKKTELKEYKATKRTKGIIAIKLKDGDSIANVTFLNDEDLILITKKGMGIHFETININPIGRNTSGVKSIKLKENDEVLIGLPYDTSKERTLAIFNTKEKGMRINMEDISPQGRGGVGVKVSNLPIAGAALVKDTDNILVSGSTTSICIAASDLPIVSRGCEGNIVIRGCNIESIVKL